MVIAGVIIFIIAVILAFTAMKKADINECLSYNDPVTRNLCISNVSIKYYDISVCNLSGDWVACINNYAQHSLNPKICEKLGENAGWCKMNIAIAKNDSSLCFGLGLLENQCLQRTIGR